MRRGWFEDGPLLSVEFARVAVDGRVTLVQVPEGPPVRALWTLFDTSDLEAAYEALRRREGVPVEDAGRDIGFWSREGRGSGPGLEAIAQWARRLDLDAALWTGLLPGMSEERLGEVPEIEDLLRHLRGLGRGALERAERYVRRTPPQIDTPYRRRFELELGWTPMVRGG